MAREFDVKAQMGDDIRRFTFRMTDAYDRSFDLLWSNLVTKLRSAFKLNDLRIRYRDDDGDLVLLEGPADLEAAWPRRLDNSRPRICPRILRFIIEPVTPSDAAVTPAPVVTGAPEPSAPVELPLPSPVPSFVSGPSPASEEDAHERESVATQANSNAAVDVEALAGRIAERLIAEGVPKVIEHVSTAVNAAVNVSLDSLAAVTAALEARAAAPVPAAPFAPAAPSVRAPAAAPSSDVLHEGVRCDGCMGNVVGVRYKCGNCPDFDLCEACEADGDIRGAHDHTHVFLKLRTPVPRTRAFFHHFHNSNLLPNLYASDQRPDCRAGRPPGGWREASGHRRGRCQRASAEPPVTGVQEMAEIVRNLAAAAPVPAPAPAPAPATAPAPAPAPAPETTPVLSRPVFGGRRSYHAKFVRDVNYPDACEVPCGTTIVKTWLMMNVGTEAWPETAALNFVQGTLFAAEKTPAIGRAVLPGERVEVSVTIRTPDSPGRHIGVFQLTTDGTASGHAFGHRVWCDLCVLERPKPARSLEAPVVTVVETPSAAVAVVVDAPAAVVASPAPDALVSRVEIAAIEEVQAAPAESVPVQPSEVPLIDMVPAVALSTPPLSPLPASPVVASREPPSRASSVTSSLVEVTTGDGLPRDGCCSSASSVTDYQDDADVEFVILDADIDCGADMFGSAPAPVAVPPASAASASDATVCSAATADRDEPRLSDCPPTTIYECARAEECSVAEPSAAQSAPAAASEETARQIDEDLVVACQLAFGEPSAAPAVQVQSNSQPEHVPVVSECRASRPVYIVPEPVVATPTAYAGYPTFANPNPMTAPAPTPAPVPAPRSLIGHNPYYPSVPVPAAPWHAPAPQVAYSHPPAPHVTPVYPTMSPPSRPIVNNGNNEADLQRALQDMGFFDRELNGRLIRKHRGDMSLVVGELLDHYNNDWWSARH